MKTMNKYFAAAALVAIAAFSMTSCATEPMSEPFSQTAVLTVDATMDIDATTRTVLSEVDGDLAVKWAAGDQLWVVNAAGNTLGVLDIVPADVGKAAAKFTGAITGATNGMKVDIYYLGTDRTPPADGTVDEDFVIDLTYQSGKFADLHKNDIMFQHEIELAVANGVAHPKSPVSMFKAMNIGHFRMVLPAGAPEITNGVLVIAGSSFSTKLTFSPTGFAYNGTPAIINGTDGDVWVLFGMGMNITPTFILTTTDNQWQFTGSLEAKNLIPGGIFIRDTTDPTLGYPVNMTITKQPKPEPDHTKNPLLKWAEGNLVYNHGTNASTIGASSGGSLYQWGRNHGFTDYRDAKGSYVSDAGSYQYGIYGKAYASGDGWEPAPYDTYSRSSYSYQDAQTLIGRPDWFVMSTGWETASGDYWPWANGGTNWAERAAALNVPADPCPDGWKMPVVADFEQIFPKIGQGIDAIALLASRMPAAEIRESDGVRYAIKWELQGTDAARRNMRVSTLVVDEDAQIGSVNWSDTNVKTRDFGATGAIEAFYHDHIVEYPYAGMTVRHNVAMPMPFGTWNVAPLGKNNQWVSVQYSNIVDAGAIYEGGYWVSDMYNGQKVIYRFRDNNGSSYGSANRNSLFGASGQPAHNAFAIRCVKN